MLPHEIYYIIISIKNNWRTSILPSTGIAAVRIGTAEVGEFSIDEPCIAQQFD